MGWSISETTARVGRRRVTARSRSPREKPGTSPYFGVPPNEWPTVTASLIDAYPVASDEIVGTVLRTWDSIFESQIGPARIGRDLFPTPQIMGFLIHELIPLEFEQLWPGQWRKDRRGADKDLVYIADDRFSTEIKTSSNPSQIFANRSYGQETDSPAKKAKAGYYLAVNFTAWEYDADDQPVLDPPARVRMIRHGWIDHTDWVAQTAATGQQSSLPPLVENTQLLRLYPD